MDKLNVVCIHSGVLFRHKKLIPVIYINVEGTGGYCVKWNNPRDRKT